MTSLPIPSPGLESSLAPASILALAADGAGSGTLAENHLAGNPFPGDPPAGNEDEQFLLHAFRSFAEAAASLERGYGTLRSEVARLRCELEQSRSDLTRSLEENRDMRTYLDSILEGLPCGVLVVSPEGDSEHARKIKLANPEAQRLLGREAADSAMHGGRFSATPFSALASPIRELLERARLRNGEQEICLAAGPVHSRWLAARHAQIPGGFSVFILRDVSERKRLEAAREKLRREQALAEISAVLAHEIRNPLASLELFAGLLAESELDGECRKWVEHVQSGLRTLAATVNNVLHFHSLPEPECAPVELGQLLDWARDFFRPLTDQARIAFSLQNRVEGVMVWADRHRLEQVLLNLVLNAVRALPGGGWIELAGRKTPDGKAAILAVSDTGPGISAEHLPRLFEPGFSTRAGSPGLGLTVCRKIVEQHGGTIEAGGRRGCGAIFTVTLPLAGNALAAVSGGGAGGALGASPGKGDR